jgi:hypothetical protein
MCLFRGAKWIYRQFFPERGKKPFIPNNKHLVLRPDGSWILDDAKKIQVSNQPPPLPAASAWHSYGPLDPIEDQIVNSPPTLFPFAHELDLKLNDCLAAGAIAGVTHTKTQDETYVLTIEIPFAENKSIEATQLGLFIRVMQDKYQLILCKQKKHISAVSSCKHHVLTFKYDPRTQLFDKK